MPYKQVFAHLYSSPMSGIKPPGEVLTLLPEGQLRVDFGGALPAEEVPIGTVTAPSLISKSVMGNSPQQAVQTPDGRFRVEIDTFVHEGVTEYWLIHLDNANGRFKRAKLTSEYHPNATAPRVSVSPSGSFFIADDSGTIRLYTAPHLVDIGAFQVAHANTENCVVALAVSHDERLIAGLSRWKDIVLYNIAERKVAFVRQIRDQAGWYDAQYGTVLIVGNADALITIGSSQKDPSTLNISVNAFKFIALPAVVG